MRRTRLLSLLSISVALFGVHASAAVDEYVLGAQDVVSISVTNVKELDTTGAILADGSISVPEVGAIKAAGKTPTRLAADIKAALEKERKNVEVVVLVKEIHSHVVRVLGAVKTPGVFDLKPGWHLLDAVTAAGGLSGKPALTTGRLIRGGQEMLTLNVPQALNEPRAEANPALADGDLIILDEQEAVKKQVFVMGEVVKRGPVDLEPGMTVLSLLSAAGGPTPQAAFSRAYVLRDNRQMPLDLYPAMVENKPETEANAFKLQPGDMLMIPANEAKFAVMGQVARPGLFDLPERKPLSPLDALGMAGGALQGGNVAKAVILRPEGDKYRSIPADLNVLLNRKSASARVTLQPSDILYVPDKGKPAPGFSDLLSPLYVLNLLGFRLWR